MAPFSDYLARFRALDVRLRKKVAVAAAAICLVAVGLTSMEPAKSVAVSPERTPSAELVVKTQEIFVHVAGAVKEPGVYRLEVGARVFDAVFAAGGLVKTADQASVNLARELADGEQLILLTQKQTSDSSQFGSTNTSTRATNGTAARVNINRATASELDSLAGIGPTLAQRIIDYRTANGGFRAIDDLDRVAGIGQTLLDRLRELVTL